MKRLMMFVSLLFAFVMGTWAQKYYVIYYDDASTTSATRYYMSIKSDGSGLERTTDFSLLCYWMADEELIPVASNTEDNSRNTKTLRSALFTNMYLNETSTGGGTHSLGLSSHAASLWLLKDNNTDMY